MKKVLPLKVLVAIAVMAFSANAQFVKGQKVTTKTYFPLDSVPQYEIDFTYDPDFSRAKEFGEYRVKHFAAKIQVYDLNGRTPIGPEFDGEFTFGECEEDDGEELIAKAVALDSKLKAPDKAKHTAAASSEKAKRAQGPLKPNAPKFEVRNGVLYVTARGAADISGIVVAGKTVWQKQ